MKSGKMSTLLLTFILIASFSTPLILTRVSRAQSSPVYYSVEPVAIAPLADVNASVNGLETPATPSPVGQNFTVEIHLRGATLDNVPNGVAGVEVHLFFGNILNYCQPTGFTDYLGQPNGTLAAPVLEAISASFYQADGFTKVKTAPYTGAVYFEVAAASTGGGWNANDGLVAVINFTITKQPNSTNGESTVNLPLELDYTDLSDINVIEVTHDTVQGMLTIDATPPPVGAKFTLTVNIIGSGTVSENPSAATYSSGTSVTLTAIPSAGSTFTSWTGDLTGTQNPINITMNSNKTVIATFSQANQFYTLTVNVVGSGSVNENPSNSSYLTGTIVTLTAVPSSNWTFTGWSGDLTGVQNPVNVTMNGNKDVNATFTQGQVSYTLTINVVYVTDYMSLITSGKIVENASITASPNASSYSSGTVVNLSVVPGLNWTFWGWSGDLTENTPSITMTQNSNITATFGLTLDLNHDGKVSLQDLLVLAKAWHSTPTSPNWNPQCVLAEVGPGQPEPPVERIGLADLVTFAYQWAWIKINTNTG